MIKKILIVLSLFFIIAQSTPIGRKWGIGMALYGVGDYDFDFDIIPQVTVIKGISKHWALVGDFSGDLRQLSELWYEISTYANIGARLYPRAESPLAPYLTGTTGILCDMTKYPKEPIKYKSRLSFKIRAGVEYFFLKHFSIGMSVRPFLTEFSWNEIEYGETYISLSTLAEPLVVGMIYF